MLYFVPELAVAKPDCAERLGGSPKGLPADLWPRCGECGLSQSLLAQFEHHEDRVNLGRQGRVLFVFQCAHNPGLCSTWEAFSGANACFVVEPEQLSNVITPIPADNPPPDAEVAITHWLTRQDNLTPEEAAVFDTEDRFLNAHESILGKATFSTRLGGVPRWLQSPDEAPGPGWRFVGQLDGTYSFYSPPSPCPSWVRQDPEQYEGRTYAASGPNFGGGLAYLFLSDSPGLPSGCMIWQR